MNSNRDTYANTPVEYLGERNDCSVRSFSIAVGISYEKSHALFQFHGRQYGRRTHGSITTRVIMSMTPGAYWARCWPNLTVSRFVGLHANGRYILHVRGHSIALVDGVVFDWSAHPHRRVLSFWKLPELTQVAKEIDICDKVAVSDEQKLNEFNPARLACDLL